jgi:hypothetical protein
MYAMTSPFRQPLKVDLPSVGLVYPMPRQVTGHDGHMIRNDIQGFAGQSDRLDLSQLGSELREVGRQINRLELRPVSSELQRLQYECSCTKLSCHEISSELEQITTEMKSSLNLCHLHYELEHCEQTGKFNFQRMNSELNRVNTGIAREGL